jgi:SAM-dependent methyltransferase
MAVIQKNASRKEVAPALPGEVVSAEIHPRDEMFLYTSRNFENEALARAQYMRQGLRIAQAFRHIGTWCIRDQEAPTVLDFAAGFGRAARFLARDFGPGRVWVSDVQDQAVEFCRRAFGVNGFASAHDPDTLAVAERFDLIVVSSLFSHLPEATFRPWLSCLAGLLAPGGVLAFSVHGVDMVDMELVPTGGHLFVGASESLTLDPSVYGTAYVTDAFVRGAIAAAFGGDAFVRLLPKGLCGAQDIYVVSLDRGRRVDELPACLEPLGYVDQCRLAPNGQLRIAGWAASCDPGDPLDHVFVELDGLRIASCANQIPRADVAAALGNPALEACGFDAEIGIHLPFSSTRVVTVVASTASGCREQLLAASLADLAQ